MSGTELAYSAARLRWWCPVLTSCNVPSAETLTRDPWSWSHVPAAAAGGGSRSVTLRELPGYASESAKRRVDAPAITDKSFPAGPLWFLMFDFARVCARASVSVRGHSRSGHVVLSAYASAMQCSVVA
eukprot:12391-Rhodomonas_salina.3